MLAANDYARALKDLDPETALAVASDVGVPPPKKNSVLRLQPLTMMVVNHQTSCNQLGTQVLTATVALTHTSLRPELQIQTAGRAEPAAAKVEKTTAAAVAIAEAATQATTGPPKSATPYFQSYFTEKATERVPQEIG